MSDIHGSIKILLGKHPFLASWDTLSTAESCHKGQPVLIPPSCHQLSTLSFWHQIQFIGLCFKTHRISGYCSYKHTGHTTWAFKTRSKHCQIPNIDAQEEPLWGCKPFACTKSGGYEGQHLYRTHAQPQAMGTTLQAILYRGQADWVVTARDLLSDVMK